LNTFGIINNGKSNVNDVKAGLIKSEKLVTKSTYPGFEINNNQAPIFSHWVNMEITITVKPIT